MLIGHSKQELWKIRDAISKATTLDEIERLSQQLQAGQIPDGSAPQNGFTNSNGGKFGRNIMHAWYTSFSD